MADQMSTSIRGAGVTTDAIPFTATNADAIAAAATPRAIKAAVTGKRHWVSSAVYSNITASEVAKLSVADGSTKKAKAVLNGPASIEVSFNPPIEITAGNAINGYCDDDVGDSYITVTGYVER